ncbi:MAG: DUF1634 domain-containing protein [Ktedonobacterales bacterium]
MADRPEGVTGVPSSASSENSVARRSELIISSVLRGGVILSAIVISIGVVAYYLATSPRLIYPGGRNYPSSIPTIWFGLTHADPVAIVALGLVILLATPVVRVAVSIVAFAISQDRLYVAITTLVLLILILSLLSGVAGGG